MLRKAILEHPLLQHNLTKLRDVRTPPVEFRRVMDQLSSLLAYEMTRDLEVSECGVETPLEKTMGSSVSDDIVIVSILRAGNGMLLALPLLRQKASVVNLGLLV